MTDLKDAVRASLTTLIAATDTAPNYLFAKPADMKELVDAGYAEGNPDLKNPNAKTEIAFRVTEAGRAAATGTQAATKPTYVIAKVAMPSIARQNSEGSKYPFASLEPEQAFFIPSEAKNASKSFGSLVSAENKKYAKNDASYRRFTSRTMTGDAFDPDGKLGLKGKKGVGVFRLSAAEEAKAKAKAFPTPAATA